MQTFLRFLTTVVLTSLVITLLHLHQAQIRLLSDCMTIKVVFLGVWGKLGYVCDNTVAPEYL